ncbi:hypothetical protein IWQ56_003866, partial [Coemansia nantahalensis]
APVHPDPHPDPDCGRGALLSRAGGHRRVGGRRPAARDAGPDHRQLPRAHPGLQGAGRRVQQLPSKVDSDAGCRSQRVRRRRPRVRGRSRAHAAGARYGPLAKGADRAPAAASSGERADARRRGRPGALRARLSRQAARRGARRAGARGAAARARRRRPEAPSPHGRRRRGLYYPRQRPGEHRRQPPAADPGARARAAGGQRVLCRAPGGGHGRGDHQGGPAGRHALRLCARRDQLFVHRRCCRRGGHGLGRLGRAAGRRVPPSDPPPAPALPGTHPARGPGRRQRRHSRRYRRGRAHSAAAVLPRPRRMSRSSRHRVASRCRKRDRRAWPARGARAACCILPNRRLREPGPRHGSRGFSRRAAAGPRVAAAARDRPLPHAAPAPRAVRRQPEPGPEPGPVPEPDGNTQT